eukprot:CAMPEP_0182912170 /NCGR_PEP_ID=MMETSP0034_2-20130328/37367_1 /TAXON_ID=156128 /ORGANISM="Nephroselmis pyriformis, Strain CCMP717" /LENGTH=233 /DNA_ID=CAMNT_0025048823 /DNA_START=66 /DNA_END=767 /DNA_ORIENTATION=+
MNNNKTDSMALTGTFSVPGYITVGTKESPLEYPPKNHVRSCMKEKQFQTNPGREGKMPSGYFAQGYEPEKKQHLWISNGDKFEDKMTYNDKQKVKHKGFLTSDFDKRDEFTKTVRVQQYREQLSQEEKFARKALAMNPLDDDEEPEPVKPRGFLYDKVFEKEDHADGFSKQARDTQNPTLLSTKRAYGSVQTASMNVGYGIDHADHSKPQFARVPLVKSTFYRASGVPFAQPK